MFSRCTQGLLAGFPNINPYSNLSSLANSLPESLGKISLLYYPHLNEFQWLSANYIVKSKFLIESSTHQSITVILRLSVFTCKNPVFQPDSSFLFLKKFKKIKFLHFCLLCLFLNFILEYS